MPAGSLIAYHQAEHKKNKKTVKEKIIFSEKNCLRHGEFDVNIAKDYTEFGQIGWNKDLPLLMLLKHSQKGSCLQIYYRSNYKWYLKFNLETHKIHSAFFSDFNSLKIYIFYANGACRATEFKLDYLNSISSNNHSTDISWGAVLDGNVVNLTPLGKMLMPPPMSFKQVELSEYPICIKWFNGQLAILSRNKLFLLYFKGLEVNKIEIDCSADDNVVDMLVSGERFYLLKDEGASVLVSFRFGFAPDEDFPNSLEIEDEKVLETKANSLFQSSQTDKLDSEEFYGTEATQGTSGFPDDLVSGLMSNQPVRRFDIYLVSKKQDFKRVLTRMSKNTLDSETIGDFEFEGEALKTRTFVVDNLESVFVLTSKKRFYLNQYLIANEVSSFEIYRNFLLFTQESDSPYNTLHVVDLKNNFGRDKLKPNQASFNPNFDERSFKRRTIERGAKICGVSDINVFLQMPRGNLEGFSPRYLALDRIMTLLENNHYEEAFVLVRKNKINTNFIYDIEPERFISSLSEFINQVSREDFINIFINSLVNELSFEAKEMKPELAEDRGFAKKHIMNKTNVVSEALLKVIPAEKTTCVLHTHMKKQPPDYLSALRLVQDMLEQAKQDSSFGKKADSALEYLCWVAKADTLFDFSLKTYNFELVIMVAKHTNKDPKAYLAYLSELQAMEPAKMKFRINCDLKFFDDAIREVSVLDNEESFQEAMKVVQQHDLFETAESAFSSSEEKTSRICLAYAEVLFEREEFVKAGEYFFKGGDCVKAVKAFSRGGSVRGVFKAAKRGKIELDDSISDCLLDACHKLRDTSELGVLLVFQPQLEQKILEEAVKFSDWQLAYWIYSQTSDATVIRKFIDDVKFNFELEKNDLIKNRVFFEDKADRLTKVQKEKKKDPEFLEFAAEELNDDSFSESGSVASSKKSFTTNASRLTKRNLNKIKNRKIKEGSPLEEIYLIGLLEELKLSEKTESKLRELVKCLRLACFKEEGDILEKEIESYKNATDIPKSLNALQQLFVDKHPEAISLFEIQLKDTNKTKKKLIEIN